MKGGKLPKQFETEEKCIAFLETLRWPEGVACPKCGNNRISRFRTSGKTGKLRQLYQCLACRYQFSVRTGTIFHDSHLPLQKWFTAMALVGESGGSISANQLRQALGVQYKTAWQLGNRLREAMQQSVHQTIQERVEAGKLPGAGNGNREEMASWERQVFLRFLDGAGRSGTVPLAASHPASGPGNSVPASNGIALAGSTSRAQRPSVPLNGGGSGIQGSVENLLGFWKREVIDSFPVVGARHIPGYMNEVTFLFGKLFLSTMPTGLLCPIGQELKRTVGTGPAYAKAGK
jgi:transposase-like protein